jgi:biotin carboxyl carrier protein
MIKATVNGGNTLSIEKKGEGTFINGEEVIHDLRLLKPGTYHLLLNQKSFTVEVEASSLSEKKHLLRINGKKFDIQLRDRFDDLLHELGMDAMTSQKVSDLKAPMPGLVVDIPVVEGQEVKKGDTLLVLEAMKMENTLKAIADVTVKKIAVKKGQAVDKNTVLIFLG